MRKHAQISVRPLTFTFKIFSKPGRQFQWITGVASWWLITLLNHTFPIGTLRAMIADAGWRDDDLLRFGLIE